MADSLFRLRINFEKRGVLRFLSHLELVRTLERTVRRAQLPYAISCGFNAHMRHAPGPALPVGTVGLDEYFDVWLTEYLKPMEALMRLKHASPEDIPVIGACYVDPKAKGLQATHTHETYEVVVEARREGGVTGDVSVVTPEGVTPETSPATVPPSEESNPPLAVAVSDSLTRLIEGGTLTVRRKKKEKVYDLTKAVERRPEVRETEDGSVLVNLHLLSSEQGSIRPELLIGAGFTIRSITRTKLAQ